MIINDKFAGLTKDESGYTYAGDIYSDDTIEINLDNHLTVKGSIKSLESIIATCGIKADEDITAGFDIKAEYGIEAGFDIKAGYGITAEYSITAGNGITAGYGITADEGIEAGYGITAGESITAGYGITAGSGIKAGESITAGWGIRAGEDIEAGDCIEAGERIFAGIKVLDTDENCKKDITCAELKQGQICYGNLILKDTEKIINNNWSRVIDTLVEIRRAKGITQSVLAESCGIKRSVLTDLENKKHAPQLDTLVKVAAALGCKITINHVDK